jgi:phosphomannomutase
MSNSLKFGTSGLRGLATDLVGDESRRYAAAFIAHLREHGGVDRVLVGRDLRSSSADIAACVIEAMDVDAIDCGEVPTPCLALEAMRLGFPAIMVTGSHIPADRNGLKFYRADGEIAKQDELGILAKLGPAPSYSASALGDTGAMRRYQTRYESLLPRNALRGRRIGVWQHSSVSRDMLANILRYFGAEVIALGRSEVFVPVDTEAVSFETAKELSDWVRALRLDAIVCTDGDGDRPLLVDGAGALVRGDIVGILTARFLSADAVVTPVTSNSSIEGTGLFQQVVRTKVGSPYVIAGMAAADGKVVGFEANGGVLLGSDVEINGTTISALPTRDALLPILCVLGAAQAAGQSVAEIVATLPPRTAASDRLEHVPAERTALFLDRLTRDAGSFLRPQGTIKTVSTIDGLRYEFESGDVIHFRPSGNAPELRCYTEASTATRASDLLSWGLSAAEAIVR